MVKSFSVISAGHLCLDAFPDLMAIPNGQFMSLFRPGRLIKTGAMGFSTGGSVSNTGLALHRLGVPVKLIAKLGNDPFAQIVKNLIGVTDQSLMDGVVLDDESETSYTIVINPPGVDRIFLHCPGANDTFTASNIDYRLVSDATLFHFGYPPLMRSMYTDEGKNLVEVFKRAKEAGITTSLDLSFPDPSSAGGKADWRVIFKNTLPYVDIFLPSFEELLFMIQRKTFDKLTETAPGGDILTAVGLELLESLSNELIEMGVKVVGIKTGYRGFYLHTANRQAFMDFGRAAPHSPDRWANKEMWSPCYQVNLVGAAGSGDSTIAGFLSALLRGMGPEEAVNMAVAVGACNVEAADTLSGIKTWEDTLTRIEKGWQKHPMTPPSPEWEWDQNYQLWVKK